MRAGETLLPVAIQGEPEMLVRGDDLWVSVTVAPRVLEEGGRVALETPLGRRIVWLTKKAGERGLVRIVGQGLPARGASFCGSPARGLPDSAARTLLRRFAAAWAA